MTEAIANRRSIRKFQSGKTVSADQLKALLEAAMLAPSAHNRRPWEFIVVTKRETLDAIAAIHPYAKMCTTAPMAIIVVALPHPEEKLVGFFPQDCGAATQNILLEAVTQGLGSCWCGVYPNETLVAEVRRLAEVEEGKIPFCVIAVGVPDESPRQRGLYEEAKVRYLS